MSNHLDSSSAGASPWQRRRFMAALVAGGCLAAGRAWGAEPAETAREVSWLDAVQTPPNPLPADAPRLGALLPADGADRPQWEARRKVLRDEWLKLLGPLATLPRAETTSFRVIDEQEDRPAGVLRQLIRYEVEPGVDVDAYLLRPLRIDPNRKLPGVAVFHSTVDHSIRQPAGVEGQPEKFFGLGMAQRGCVAICPRNFLWPDNLRIDAQGETKRFQQRHPDSLGMARMLRDSQIAVDILAGLPNVDANRLGAVGHSLGAKEVLYLAALDERIRVTVSSEGGIGTSFSNWDAPWYLGPTIKQPGFAREHHELLAMVAPRAFLLVGGDSADGDRSWPFIAAALPVYRWYTDTPRVGLLNHKQGHSVPADAERRIYAWLETYLRTD